MPAVSKACELLREFIFTASAKLSLFVFFLASRQTFPSSFSVQMSPITPCMARTKRQAALLACEFLPFSGCLVKHCRKMHKMGKKKTWLAILRNTSYPGNFKLTCGTQVFSVSVLIILYDITNFALQEKCKCQKCQPATGRNPSFHVLMSASRKCFTCIVEFYYEQIFQFKWQFIWISIQKIILK